MCSSVLDVIETFGIGVHLVKPRLRKRHEELHHVVLFCYNGDVEEELYSHRGWKVRELE